MDFNALYLAMSGEAYKSFDVLYAQLAQRWITESYKQILAQHDALEIAELERMWEKSYERP